MNRDGLPDGFVYLPCQICGKPVLVKLPFVGCVFCRDCPVVDSSWAAEANNECFKYPFREEG